MVDTAPRTGASTALPDHAVVPPVWGRITNLDVDRGEGSWLITRDGERYLDYSSGIGVTNTGHAHPRVVAAVQAQAAKLLHGQQNILYHEPGLRLYDRLRSAAAGRAVAGVPVELRRGGGRGLGQAGARRDRPAGDPGLPLRLPRPDRPDDGAHDRQGRLPRPPSSRSRAPSTTRPTRTAIGPPGGAHAPDACTCDWEAELDLTFHQFIYPDRVAASSSNRSSARAATSSRRRRSCRASARSPASTASCSSPTRSRPASAGPARCSRCATGTSSPTSWSWPRASPRGCRSPGSWPGPS